MCQYRSEAASPSVEADQQSPVFGTGKPSQFTRYIIIRFYICFLTKVNLHCFVERYFPPTVLYFFWARCFILASIKFSYYI